MSSRAAFASLAAFGRYLPDRVLGNQDLAAMLGCEARWILEVSGIEERRIALPEETVADMAVAAARNCLASVESPVGMVIVSSASAEARFPGPAAEIAQRLGLAGVPAIDLPVASAGSLFGMALADRLTAVYGNILLIASEKMSPPALAEPLDKSVAILFGDGAAACLVSPSGSGLRIVDSVLHSDGSWSQDLRLGWDQPIHMNGRSVIMQASRKIPAAIDELLTRNGVAAGGIGAFLMHQANQNLIDRVARAAGVPEERFYSNIRKYGNTSSASMLIAASEWHDSVALSEGDMVCFAAFGAGFHWGALLAGFH